MSNATVAMNNAATTARFGVNKVDTFFSEHRWLFREQYSHDHGIDAQVEIVNEGKPTGDLIGIQIKSGKSYFSECTDTSYICRENDRHIDYWRQHCLPVIIILYNPDEDILYWESVSTNSCVRTEKGWKINVPKDKQLTGKSLRELRELTQPSIYLRNLHRLLFDKAWIELAAEGEFIYIEFEDWINKSLPRFNIRIGCDSRSDIEEGSWPTIYGNLSIEEALSYTIPWAIFKVDEDAYHDSMRSKWHAECYLGKDEGEEYFTRSFEDWYEPPSEGIIPISDNGETQKYRLILNLNQIGRSFLVLDKFLKEKDLSHKILFSDEF